MAQAESSISLIDVGIWALVCGASPGLPTLVAGRLRSLNRLARDRHHAHFARRHRPTGARFRALEDRLTWSAADYRHGRRQDLSGAKESLLDLLDAYSQGALLRPPTGLVRGLQETLRTPGLQHAALSLYHSDQFVTLAAGDPLLTLGQADELAARAVLQHCLQVGGPSDGATLRGIFAEGSSLAPPAQGAARTAYIERLWEVASARRETSIAGTRSCWNAPEPLAHTVAAYRTLCMELDLERNCTTSGESLHVPVARTLAESRPWLDSRSLSLVLDRAVRHLGPYHRLALNELEHDQVVRAVLG